MTQDLLEQFALHYLLVLGQLAMQLFAPGLHIVFKCLLTSHERHKAGDHVLDILLVRLSDLLTNEREQFYLSQVRIEEQLM